MLENEHTDRIFLTTCFLWVHIALSVSEQSTSSVLSSQPLLQSITHKIFSNPIPCSKSQLFSSMKENSHEYSLSDLQLSLSLIMNPYHSSVPPSFCSPSLLAPPPSPHARLPVESGVCSSQIECPLLFKTFSVHPGNLPRSQAAWKSLKLLGGASLVGSSAGWKLCKWKLLRNVGTTKGVQKDGVFIVSRAICLKLDSSHFLFPKLCPIFLDSRYFWFRDYQHTFKNQQNQDCLLALLAW